MITPQLRAAFVRSAGLAATAFVVCAAAALLNGATMKAAAIYGLAGAGSALGYRGLGEGFFDGNRASKGLVKPGDVKPLPSPPLP